MPSGGDDSDRSSSSSRSSSGGGRGSSRGAESTGGYSPSSGGGYGSSGSGGYASGGANHNGSVGGGYGSGTSGGGGGHTGGRGQEPSAWSGGSPIAGGGRVPASAPAPAPAPSRSAANFDRGRFGGGFQGVDAAGAIDRAGAGIGLGTAAMRSDLGRSSWSGGNYGYGGSPSAGGGRVAELGGSRPSSFGDNRAASAGPSSFANLTRSMDAPALGFMAGPTPTYGPGSMAYATGRPTDNMSSLTEPTRVRSSFVDARGLAPMSSAFTPGNFSAPTREALESYIAQAARARGIDPATAIAVARSEGLYADPKTGWRSTVTQKDGKQEPSYGVYQLHDKYMGKEFTKATGLAAKDPSSVYAAIDYALDQAASKKSWGSWYGAAKVGVSKSQGLDNAKAIGVSQQARDFAAGKPAGPVNASAMQDYTGKAPNVTEFAATPQTGPSIGVNRNEAAVANRMDAKSFAEKYLSASALDAARSTAAGYAPLPSPSPAAAAIDAISPVGPTDLEDRPIDAVQQGAKAISDISAKTGVAVSVKDERDLATLNPSIVDVVARAAAMTEYGQITVTSTHRDTAQNRGVGGVVNSYHTQLDGNGKARAVDVRTRDNTRAEAKALANEINKTPGLRAIVESDHVHVQMERLAAASLPETGPIPTPRGQMAVASSATPVSTTAPNYGNPPVPGLQPASVADAPNSVPATSIASADGATPAASTTPSTDFPARPNAPLGPGGKMAAGIIDNGAFFIPGIGPIAGTGISLINGALTLTGNRSLGTMMVENFLSGDRTGAIPWDENSRGPEPSSNGGLQPPAPPAQTAAAPPPSSFVDKYILPKKKFQTPEEKWGSRSYNPTAA